MDCRTTLLLAAILAGISGCVHPTAIPLDQNGDQTAGTVRQDSDPGKLTPKASTCVAFGAFSERCASDDKKYSPVERDRLYDQARQAYQRALQIEPTDLAALTSLARLYVQRNDHARAVAIYEKAIAAHPKEVELWYELGLCHAQKKDWDPALRNLSKAVELDPENLTRNRSLGFCLARAGHIDESFTVFAKVDGAASAHYNVARMLLHMKQDRQGKEHLHLALQLQPDLVAARQLLASVESGQAANGQEGSSNADTAKTFLAKP